MSLQTLHITNGNSLTDYLNEINIVGEILTWQEMLCEGPTISNIDSEEFILKRKAFLSTFYDIEMNVQEFKEEINILNNINNYKEVVLWFEYDLFCHINMIAVISLLKQKKCQLPIYLVCSGRIEGEKNLKGLSELTTGQLLYHYKNKVLLNNDDIELATTLWDTYCGKDHNLLKPYITKKSSFQYLSNCLKAHITRFPNLDNGLSVLEENILSIVKDNPIRSKHHLLGYILNYQGYYGFGDTQINRLIDKLSIFFSEADEQLSLNRKGHEALYKKHNFAAEIDNNLPFGGVNRLDFQYSKKENKLIKTQINAN
ncbi:DUF1835 domain-containing protein [Corallibacter sp.]|uniref:DUF1835 domain-containing protein n=1 Tax=Corallibacter sp. TaxID=2038084 RepID=UPI003A8FAB56